MLLKLTIQAEHRVSIQATVRISLVQCIVSSQAKDGRMEVSICFTRISWGVAYGRIMSVFIKEREDTVVVQDGLMGSG